MNSGLFTVGKDVIASTNSSDVESAVRSMVNVAGSTVDGKAIEENVRGFVENSKILMGALDEVAKIHPFISIVRLIDREYIL
jgi:hypothetical protein